jgi:transcriptional regulator with XRE-family HTH domain
MVVNWIEIGRLVRLRRKEQRLSQTAMAVALGLSPRALGELERGQVVRPRAKLIAAVRAFVGGPLPGASQGTVRRSKRFTAREIDIRRAQDLIVRLGQQADPELWSAVRQVLVALPSTRRRRGASRALPTAAEMKRAQQELAVLGRQAPPALWAGVMEVLTALDRGLEERVRRKRKSLPAPAHEQGECAR